MEVSPQFCVVQQEPEESIFAQEKPELPSMLHRLEGLKVRKVSEVRNIYLTRSSARALVSSVAVVFGSCTRFLLRP